MPRFVRAFLLPALLLLPLTAAGNGGWFVVTMHQWPDHLVAGEPVALAFTLRQHGMTPMTGRTVHVMVEGQKAVAFGLPDHPGGYRVVVTPRTPGELRMVVDPHLYGITQRTAPIRVVAAASEDGDGTTMTLPDRGRHLFRGKGCMECHAHGAVGPARAGVGGDLTNRRYNPGILRRVLRDPDGILEFSTMWTMPALELTDSEIDAIIAFINQ